MTREIQRGAKKTLLAFLLMAVPHIMGHASRPYVSMETIIKRSPVLFEGTVTAQNRVQSPTRDSVLYDSTTALQLSIASITSWKPRPFPTSVSVYSRTPNEAPCTGVSVENGKKYIIFGHFDTSDKFILADWCGDIIDATSVAGLKVRRDIVAIYGKAQ